MRHADNRNAIDRRQGHDVYRNRRSNRDALHEKLEAVERGEIDRLMIFMPPRHGKSEKTSKRFPAWYLGRNPKRQIIASSYNSDLATTSGANVRNIVASPEYGEVFSSVLRQDSRAADRMNTNAVELTSPAASARQRYWTRRAPRPDR
jgi:hypothetical protein